MTCATVVAQAIVRSLSDRANLVSWIERAGFGPAHFNNLGLREKNRPLF
jgi:hypothetical protein